MLSGLRALELPGELGCFCGKILAHFGIDVIKIEKVGGEPERNIGPFYHDIQDPEKSLYWFAYNESKKGITLNLESPEGQDIFKKLAAKSDFIIESFPVGHMEKLGLDYQDLNRINPGLIMTSITPFGQTGPYKNYKATDLIAMAMGGIMSLNGEPEGLPCRLDQHHSYCVTGAYAALSALIAYYYRTWSGEGQYIDVSLVECAVKENYYEVPVSWTVGRFNAVRRGPLMYRAGVTIRCIWPCKDGYVTWNIFGGRIGARENQSLADWLDEEGISKELKSIDWEQFDFNEITQEKINMIEKPISELIKRYTKRDIENEAIKRGIRLSAVNDIKDLDESGQLAFRNYWKVVDHPELSDSIKYPGQLFMSTETETGPRHRAPLIGEHNKEIYEDELGFDRSTMADLEEKGII